MKTFLLALLAAAALTMTAESEFKVLYRNDFNVHDECGSVKTGRKGSSADFKLENGGLRLRYQLPGDGDTASLQLPVNLEELPEKLELALTGDGSMNLILLRLVDAGGETHQYRSLQLKEGELLAEIDFKSFSAKRINIFGGDRNKKLDLPIKSIAIEIRNASKYWSCRPSGEIRLKSLQLLSKAAAKAVIAGASSEEFPVLTALPTAEAKRAVPATLSGDGVSGKITATFDDRYLYFDIEVADRTINTPSSGTAIYENDAVELFFDCRRDSTLQLNQEDDYQVVVTPSTGGGGGPEMRVYRNGRAAHIYADSSLTAERIPSGYRMRLKLPVDAFTGMLNPLKAIGFAMNIVDNDGTHRKKIHWAGTAPLEYGVLAFGPLDETRLAALRAERRTRLALLRPAAEKPMKNSYRGEPVIHRVDRLTAAARRFEKFELEVRLDAEYANPFDFEEVRLEAHFIAPGGGESRVDGFLDQPHAISFNAKVIGDVVAASGPLRWLIRYAPRETGEYRCRVALTDRKGRRAEAQEMRFTVAESENPGFLQVSPHDPRYLAFTNGDGFFGVGFAGHSWDRANVVLYIKHYLNQLAAFGGNYTSINLEVIGDGGFSLETAKVGQYNLANASRLDYVLECAGRRGVYLIPCLMQTQLATSRSWERSRYSAKRGGPCQTPEEFFSSPEARRLIKNRLRYLIARWGYSTAILGFEIFNEVNYTDGARKNPASVVEFHRDLAAYLKEIDPNRHLVSTSFGSGITIEMPEIWRLPQIDFVITHAYSNDIAGELLKRLVDKRSYGKPNIGGENGIPASVCMKAREVDPAGIAIHNNLWGSMIAGSAGNVLQWWYSHYGDPLDLYAVHYPPFVRFIRDIRFDREELTPGTGPVFSRASEKGKGAEKIFPLDRQWHRANGDAFFLEPDGVWREIPLAEAEASTRVVADIDRRVKEDALPGLLRGHGRFRFEVTLPEAGALRLALGAVGVEGAHLALHINGKEAFSRKIADRDGRNNPDADELDDRFELPLAAGKNTVEIANGGAGFLTLKSLEVTHLSRRGVVEGVRFSTLRGPRLIIGWAQDSASTWYRGYRGETPELIRGAAFELPGLTGRWRIEWFDTWDGKVIASETRDFNGKEALIPIPEFTRDLALKMRKE